MSKKGARREKGGGRWWQPFGDGASMRSVARAQEVSLSTVQWWWRRAGQLSLDDVDWSDHAPIPDGPSNESR